LQIARSAVCFAILCAAALATTGTARAGSVTIDGVPVSGAIARDGHLLVPFRAPMQQLGATVRWSDADKTGIASAAGHELVRTAIGVPTAYIDGNAKQLDTAPVLIDHLEYVPVEMLPEISHAELSVSADGNSAAITGFDLAGVNAVGSDAVSGDPQGQILYLWLWLLPISAAVCFAAYMVLTAQLQLDHTRPRK
jgi:hypothetical protein